MRTNRYIGLLHKALVAMLLVSSFAVAGATRAGASPVGTDRGTSDEVGTYKNQILPEIPGRTERVETFADPSIIYAKDGFYYAYGTKDPRFDGDEFHVIPIIRSNDLVTWTYVGDAFPQGNPPSADPAAGIFAPDIRYINDQYYLYYSITDRPGSPRPDPDNDSAIGVATSPNPNGPFTDRGVVVEPQPNPCCQGSFRATIDPHVLPLPDGRRLIYFGSYFGGLFVRELSADGLTTDPRTERRIAIDNRYEAPYVIRRGREYFMFVSASDCCNFESTGYVVFAGKSNSPFGPFRDREGDTFLDPHVGGEIVLAQNGNKFVGVGHNAVFTDQSGQDYIVYHGINKFDPEVIADNGERTFDINRRAFMIDRLDYINGFPVTRAGLGPSEVRQPAPTVTGPVHDEYNRDRQSDDLRGEYFVQGNYWSIVNTRDNNYGYVRQRDPNNPQTFLINNNQTPADYRAEGDARLIQAATGRTERYGLVTGYRDNNNYIAGYLQPGAGGVGGSLVTNVRRGGVDSLVTTPLPPNFKHTDFHNIVATKRGARIIFEVTESRLQDILARQDRLNLGTAAQAGRVGFATQFASANFDNLFGVGLHTPVTRRADTFTLGTLQERYSDEFNGGLDPENMWSYVGPAEREPSQGQANPQPDNPFQERQGYYRHRTDETELTRQNPPSQANRPRILVQDAPAGDYTVEIKLELPLPDNQEAFPFQQAGVFIYENDDKFVRLDELAIFNTRQIEFGKEKPSSSPPENFTGEPRQRRFGSTVLDNPAKGMGATWLRIVKRTDSTGEQEYTAFSSVDGVNFDRGGTWTFGGPENFTPANERALQNPKIGITAFGEAVFPQEINFDADFDYVRVYTP